MKKIVVLAEKPSQASEYAKSFRENKKENGYFIVSDENFENTIITYGFGHLVSLYSPEEYNKDFKSWSLNTLPILPETFKFKVGKGKTKQYNIVKKHLDSADEIIIATDTDREGEAIARLIINLSGNSHKQIKRLWINSLEKEEIKKGFNNLRNGEEFYSSYKEAETRQFADWLVGINLSRLYTLYMRKNGMNGVFSIGRVQTPTLHLIYKRNMEIENFISKPFYELFANFKNDKGMYQGKYLEKFNTLEELKSFKENNSLEKSQGIVEEIKTEEKKQYAPKLFSLSDLQSIMNKQFNYGASETLEIMQSLYEKKVLSYPRTDTNYIGSPEFAYLKNNLSKYLNIINENIENPQMNEDKRYVDSKKVQEHYAIIPTSSIPDLEKFSEKEIQVYKTIIYRTIAIFETPYIYDETTILTNINTIPFKTTGKIEKNLGWKRLFKEENNNVDKHLPNLSKDEILESELESKKGETTPPKFYTEGTLISAMKNVGRTVEDEEDKNILKETEGIGTEATRANVIDTLKNQDYVIIQKNKMIVTEKGKTLCSTIKGNEITNSELTAKWEKYLKKIKQGEGTQKVFLESIVRFINHLIESAPETFNNSDIKNHVKKIDDDNKIGICPNCKNNIIDKGKFYGCTGYNSNGCKFSLPKEWSNKKLSIKNIKDLLTKNETSLIKGFESKKGYSFSAKLKLNNNKIEFIFDNK